MLYDILDHPLLSDGAKDLDSAELATHARVAETLLGLLKFTAFAEGTDFYDRATDAVALQVSFQVEAGIEAFILTHETRGARKKDFRGRGRMPPIHPTARKIVSGIKPAVLITGARA